MLDPRIRRARSGILAVDQRGAGARNLRELAKRLADAAHAPNVTVRERLRLGLRQARLGHLMLPHTSRQ